MRYVNTLQLRRGYFIKCVALIAAMCLAGAACHAQAAPADKQAESPWSEDVKKYPTLPTELGQLFQKLQKDVQYPAARTESQLLPLLPQSTMLLAAISNYGDPVAQALKIFRQQLQESPVLRDWWEHGEVAADARKAVDVLDKISQLHQYLGEEIVVSGVMEGQNPKLLMMAKIRKPGLKEFLQQMVEQLAGKSKPGVRVLDLTELAAAKEGGPPQELMVLVRPDYAVAALDLATLRSFNVRVEGKSREFASTPFGERAVEEYRGGLTLIAAADLHQILTQIPPEARQNATFQRSGFADLKYIVWAHKNLTDKTVSQTELSFTAPRHGVAAGLANSSPLGSLDFVSPKAVLAASVVLKNPARIYEAVRELAGPANAKSFAIITQAEQGLQLSLKDDLLNLLGGEITMEVDNVTSTQPAGKVILGVKDAKRLEQTLSTLLASANLEVAPSVVAGVTYHKVRIPSQTTPTEIGYAFVDGYLVVGSGRGVVAEAVRLHRTGGSLAKSRKFLASLPPGPPLQASALFYADPVAMAAVQMRQVMPEMAESLAQTAVEASPAVVCVYGEDTAIREASTSPSFDAGAVMIVAAIAIPNLLRSRQAANEASAVGSLRSVNTAQVAYALKYPERGFAPNLATLGPGPGGAGAASADHADMLDGTLANASCTGDAWCTKSGYQFRVASVCEQNRCREFVVLATPVTPGTTGTRNFCSTKDRVIRFSPGPSAVASLSAAECKAWPPIQ